MLKNTFLAALAIIAFGGFASAGILDAYDLYANTSGAYTFHQTDRLTTSGINGGNTMACSSR